MTRLPKNLKRRPYKQDVQVSCAGSTTGRIPILSEPNGSLFDSLEHPANASAGVIQWSESILYTDEVAGSSPAAGTTYPSKELPLTLGYVALVSPEDYERSSVHKWTAMPTKRGRTVYARRSVWGEDGKCRTILLHRFLTDASPDVKVDHRDRNGLDCRRHNLRTANNSQSGANRRQKNSAPGMLGVQTRGRSYRGCVKLDDRTHYTPTFPCPILAAAARDVLAQKLHGEFVVLNFQFIPLHEVQTCAQ